MAAEAAIAKATALREEASAQWRSKDYRAAADALKQAAAIYRKAGPSKHLAELAHVSRAIVWNEVDDGQVAAAFEWFEELSSMTSKADAGFGREVQSAYAAIYRAATNAESGEERIKLCRRARKVLRADGHAGPAAQCLHDIAGFEAEAGDLKAMRRSFAKSVAERKKIRDFEGVAWSHNNQAYRELEAGRAREAVAPLRAAFAVVRSHGVTAVSNALSINLARLIELEMADEARPSRPTLELLWSLAAHGKRKFGGVAYRGDRIVRDALLMDARVHGNKHAAKAARRAAAIAQAADWPGEITADVLLCAARRALQSGGDSELARRLVDSMPQLAAGPCTAHLAAREAVLRACCARRSGDPGAFDRFGQAALRGMRAVGHRTGVQRVLEMLTAGEVEGSAELAA